MTKLLLKRALAAIAGLVLLYAAAGFLLLPAVLKSQAEKMAADTLKRQLSIDKVEFNPFTLALNIHGLKLMEPAGDAVFVSFDALALDLSGQSLWQLAPVVQQVRLSGPYVHLVRQDANHYSIDDILALLAKQPPSPQPARFSVNNIQIDGGRVEFDDRPARAVHKVADLTLGLPFISSLPAHVQLFVEPLLSAKVNGAPLLVKGKVRPYAEPKDFLFELELDNVDLPPYLDYLPFKPNFKLSGARLDARLNASFRQVKDKSPALVLGGTARLKTLQLTQADGKPLLRLDELALDLGKLDVLGGRFELARLSLDGLQADVSRDRDGVLNMAQLLPPPDKAAAKPAPAAAPTSAPAPAPAPAPYVSLGELEIRNAAVRYSDATPQGAMRAGVDKFALSARKLVADLGKNNVSVETVVSDSAGFALQQDKRAAAAATAAKPATAAAPDAAPLVFSVAQLDIKNWSARIDERSHDQPLVTTLAPFNFSMKEFSTAPASRSQFELQATIDKAGKLAANGSMALSPFATDVALDLKNFDLLPLQPYVTDYVNLRLTQGAVSTKARLQLASGSDGVMKGSFKGDASVNRLTTVDKASTNDFLSWKALTFGGIDLQLQPFSLSMEQVGLSDFFARVIIDPSGRINVQDVVRDQANEDRSLTEAATRADAPGGRRQAKTKAAPVPAPTPAPAAEPLPPIRIGKLTLSGGRVRFTDNFIKPNYTANMKDLGGTVTGLSSNAASNANVNLRGAVNGAPLSIAGQINPLKRDLFLDVKADVRGMELAALSAYSERYVGYGIEKGKLSFEVAYRLENRQLTAQNRLILDQLTFGSESTNPDVTKLPVGLAVALLSDRNGIIDIEVPVGGSLDDPQFSIGGIVLKIIGNAIVKAVTSPFAMLGSLFGGGGEELSMLEFEPGRAALPTAAESKLKALAKALTERPGLKLDIAGRFDSAVDIEALKRVSIERKVRALKTRDMQARGEAPPAAGVTVGKGEYPALLARAFKDETFAKPRNALGLQKSLSPAEMEQLMLTHAQVDEDDLLALGNRRAQAAKAWLITTGQVPAERVFIVSTKPAASGEQGASRVDFALR